MPEEPVIERESSPATEQTVAEYRKEREAGTSAADRQEIVDPAKSAAGTEPADKENSEGTEEAEDKGKPRGGFQRRIDKLTKEKSDLERTVAESQQTTAELKTRLDALEKKNPEVKEEAKASGDPKPKVEDFKVYEEFIEALSKWTYRQESKAASDATAKSQREEQQKQSTAQKKAKFDTFVSELRTVREAHPDIEQLFAEMSIPNYIHTRLVNMGKAGAEVTYELAKNKEVQAKIVELNQKAIDDAGGQIANADFSDAYWEFGAFVRSVTQKSSPNATTRPVSQAPTPISPVRGGEAVSEADPDKMSAAEYRRARESGKIR